MKTLTLLISLFFFFSLIGQNQSDKTQIVTTLNNYVDGFYKGDTTKLKKTIKADKSHQPKVSTYYLIRHAEKDRSNKTNQDPHLNKTGKKRAKDWADYFKDVKFDAIYSTNYNRTKETATPTAKSKNLDIQFYDPSDFSLEEFTSKTKGKTVLIVGHSNTTPMFTNGLLGTQKYKDMADDDNTKLFKVTITKDKKSSEVLSIK